MTILMTREQWDRVLCSTHADERLEDLQKAGTLRIVFPEVQSVVGFGDGSEMKDLWAHTKQVVIQSLDFPIIRWAALFHDVGKPKCFQRDKDGHIGFHGHESVSAKLFCKAADRTNLFSKDDKERIRFLIYHLGRVEEYDSSWNDSAVRRLYRHTHAYFHDLIALARADISTKNQAKRQKHHERMKEFRERALELARMDAVPQALPTGLGDALSEQFGIPKSRQLGDLMAKIKGEVEAGNLGRSASISEVLDFVKTQKLV